MVIAFAWLALVRAGTASADELEDAVRQGLAETFSLAAFLTNGETIRFGVWDFDPNEVFRLEDPELGSAESSELRRSIRNVMMPLTTSTPLPQWNSELIWGGSLALIEVTREGQLVASEEAALDEIRDQVFSVGAHARWDYFLRPDWHLRARIEGRWMRYRNDTAFRTVQSRRIEPDLDGLVSNIRVKALMTETAIGTWYQNYLHGSVWHWTADVHYLAGDTYDTDVPAHNTQPRAWFTRAGVRIRDPLRIPLWRDQSLWLEAYRVDMGGDLDGQLGNDHYYELGGGWQMEMPDWVPYLDNIAIGININYGSVLRGGTLVFLFNEE
ncbi:Solitary outer membrane autotransporter beta-barrel domain [Marinobacter salinisoli]|uniref:Solitary outer membrane autotransporter beta-barrel domain n=1 Tax=Marinobacter salinisoli TaxID=2769486 RepID=A0ABX7MQZ1_9GAMM|nr:Solitary outer membrane autotransporter beta-barrel domain [Marinobacter salinisoli]QSP94723.1 Solitary outer membrane autotransporter beta-barrel domain [Marinobacter salinisoli]